MQITSPFAPLFPGLLHDILYVMIGKNFRKTDQKGNNGRAAPAGVFMIDRISRNFVHYSAYRQQMSSRVALNEAYEVRQSLDIVDLNGRARLLATSSYPRQSLEHALIRAAEESNRIRSVYTSPSLGYVPPQIDSLGLPHIGQNIDMTG